MNNGKKYDFKIQSLQKRKEAVDINYRKFNNFVKNYLIIHDQKENESLLDIAAGKLSDIHKWLNSKYSLIMGIDYSYENIYGENGAYDRLKKIDIKEKTIIPIWGDCIKNIRNGISGENKEEKNKLKKFFKTHPRFKFDKITINFAIHYFLEHWNGFYKNIKNLLKKGGVFVGTYLDGNKILEILGKNNEKKFYNINGDLIYTIQYKNEKEISVKTETWPYFIDEFLVLEPFDLKHFKLIQDEPFIKLKTEKHKMSKDEILLANINRYFIYERI